jgi:zinc protease
MKRTPARFHPCAPLIPRAHLFVTALIATLAWLVQPVAAADSKPAPAAKGTLPKARTVIDQYVKAIGGRDALLKHRSFHAKGTFEIPGQGIKGDVELFMAAPAKHLVQIEISGLGLTQAGYDGKVGWSIDPTMGPRLMEGKELDQLKYESDFLGALHEEKNYKSMETVEATQFDGRECYKLKLVRTSGDEVFEYFDVKTGLAAGMTLKAESPVGAMDVTAVTTDYKKFGDVQMPTKMIQKMMNMQQVITLESGEFDKIEDAVFELPAKIKALVKKK